MRHASAIWSPLCSLLLCYLFIDYWISRALVLMRGHRHCSAYAHCWNTGIRDPVFCCGISTRISLVATYRVQSWLAVPGYPIDPSVPSPSLPSTSHNWRWFLKEIIRNECHVVKVSYLLKSVDVKELLHCRWISWQLLPWYLFSANRMIRYRFVY